VIDKQYPDRAELESLVKVCPAGLYSFGADGKFLFDYIGCLECGTCRVLSGGRAVRAWNYPVGTFGVTYRHG
jgi:ferredoxin like protein